MSKQCEFQLVGGIGNQLFILAAATSHLADGFDTVINKSNLDSYGNNHGNSIAELVFDKHIPEFVDSGKKLKSYRFRLASILSRITKVRHFGDWMLEHETGFVELSHRKWNKCTKHFGYFQSWKYSFYGEVINPIHFEFKNESAEYLKYRELAKSEKPLVIHIRRGDYLTQKDIFGVLGLDYYKSALELAKDSQFNTNNIWIFSDDSDFALEVASICSGNVKIFGSNTSLSDIENLAIMSLGLTHILANSSFSWWAAMMSRETRKVFAPAQWFKNMKTPESLVPENWVKIPSSWI